MQASKIRDCSAACGRRAAGFRFTDTHQCRIDGKCESKDPDSRLLVLPILSVGHWWSRADIADGDGTKIPENGIMVLYDGRVINFKARH